MSDKTAASPHQLRKLKEKGDNREFGIQQLGSLQRELRSNQVILNMIMHVTSASTLPSKMLAMGIETSSTKFSGQQNRHTALQSPLARQLGA